MPADGQAGCKVNQLGINGTRGPSEAQMRKERLFPHPLSPRPDLPATHGGDWGIRRQFADKRWVSQPARRIHLKGLKLIAG